MQCVGAMVRRISERRGEKCAVLYGTRVGGGTHLKSIVQCDQNPRAAGTNSTPLYRTREGRGFRRHPFSGLVASAGELLHTP